MYPRLFFYLILLFMVDFPGTFEQPIFDLHSDVEGIWKGKTIGTAHDSSLEKWIFIFKDNHYEMINLEQNLASQENTFKLFDQYDPKRITFNASNDIFLGIYQIENDQLKLSLFFTSAFGFPSHFSEGKFFLLEKQSSTERDEEDETRVGNQIGFALVFIVLYLPAFLLLSLQIYRTIIYQRNRGTTVNYIWIEIKNIGKRLNIHLLLKISFSLLCFVRLIHGLLFIIHTLQGEEDKVLDQAIRFWIDYITFNFLYSCASLGLFYWIELGLASVDQIGKKNIASIPFISFVIVLNLFFHIITFTLLPIMVRREGDSSTVLFQTIYLIIVCVPMITFALSAIAFVKLSMRKLKLQDGKEKVLALKAFKKISIILYALVIAIIVRGLMELILLVVNFESFTTQAVVIFIGSSIPELVLSYTMIKVTWIRKSSLAYHQQEFESDALIAPEISQSEQ